MWPSNSNKTTFSTSVRHIRVKVAVPDKCTRYITRKVHHACCSRCKVGSVTCESMGWLAWMCSFLETMSVQDGQFISSLFVVIPTPLVQSWSNRLVRLHCPPSGLVEKTTSRTSYRLILLSQTRALGRQINSARWVGISIRISEIQEKLMASSSRLNFLLIQWR